jgi:hypothetical protein
MIQVQRQFDKPLIVHDDGRVEIKGQFGPSDTWRIAGAVRFNNFGHIVQRYSLTEVLKSDLRCRHKNGKPRIYLTDLNHGTHRMQMSPSVYDVRRI